jgi:hypothetical protein
MTHACAPPAPLRRVAESFRYTESFTSEGPPRAVQLRPEESTSAHLASHGAEAPTLTGSPQELPTESPTLGATPGTPPPPLYECWARMARPSSLASEPLGPRAP